jgi:hypothetical protein
MPSLDDTVAKLRLYNKYHRNYTRQKISLENRMNGMVAAELGYDPSNGNDIKLYNQAVKMVSGLLAKEPRGDLHLQIMMGGFIEAHKCLKASLKDLTKSMEKLAKELPIYEWSVDIPGIGAATLAKIVAEVGGVNNNGFGDYETVSRVWKRMGLAVMPDGKRQRRIKGEAAIEHGYDAQRRSEMFMAANYVIMKGKALDHPLYAYYMATKARVRERCSSDGHADMYAKRLLAKKLLKWMWKEWNRAAIPLEKAA